MAPRNVYVREDRLLEVLPGLLADNDDIGSGPVGSGLRPDPVVDEYRLWVLPAATGKGAPLFPELDQPVNLRLVRSRAFPSGVLELVYTPADR